MHLPRVALRLPVEGRQSKLQTKLSIQAFQFSFHNHADVMICQYMTLDTASE